MATYLVVERRPLDNKIIKSWIKQNRAAVEAMVFTETNNVQVYESGTGNIVGFKGVGETVVTWID